jgi:hypothetical protein
VYHTFQVVPLDWFGLPDHERADKLSINKITVFVKALIKVGIKIDEAL